jgi:glyoxylate reductase
LPTAALEQLEADFGPDLVMYDDTPADVGEVQRRVQGAEIIVANLVEVDELIIDAAGPNLRNIIVTAVGYDSIAHEYAAEKGIAVRNCPTQNSQAVAEHAMGLMFGVGHRIMEASQYLQDGGWSQHFIGTELAGKRLGLVGYGNVGQRIERMAQGFMDVRHANSQTSPEELDELVDSSNVLCLAMPLNDKTRNSVNERRLGMLGGRDILINVGRGPTVDNGALYRRLASGAIFGAGLDVYEDEPIVPGFAPESIMWLARLPNVVATPHTAYATFETADRMGDELRQNLLAATSDEYDPLHVVNQPLGS